MLLKHLKYIDGSADKFWQIETDGTQYTVVFGRNGTAGTTQVKTFGSEAECLKAAEKLLAEKLKKGYSETGEVGAASSPKIPQANADALKALLDEYDHIIVHRQKDRLLPLLRDKAKGHLIPLRKHVKKSWQYWTEYVEVKDWRGGKWEIRGDWEQRKMIALSIIGLCDQAEVQRNWGTGGLLRDIQEDEAVRDILLWARPTWLGDYLLSTTRQSAWGAVFYRDLRYLEDEGLVDFVPELFALTLGFGAEVARALNANMAAAAQSYLAWILADTKAYTRDVPLLMEYPTSMHLLTLRRGGTPEQATGLSFWDTALRALLDEGKLDRPALIAQALQIQTKEWNNDLKAFFRKFLVGINVTDAELLACQDTLFTFLQHPHPPIVGYGTDLVKRLYELPGFHTETCLEWVSHVMMRNDCKGNIKKLIPLYEKIGKRSPALRGALSQQLADVLLIADLALQERAAKALLKLGDSTDTALCDKLADYTPQMLDTVKAQLQPFLGRAPAAVPVEVAAYSYQPDPPTRLATPVALLETWQDLFFHFGTFLSSGSPADAELLLNAYATQRHLFPRDYAAQLAPYSKKIAESYTESEYLWRIHCFLRGKASNIAQKFTYEPRQYVKLATFKVLDTILVKIDDKISSGSTLPLLSCPTHLPHWIAPRVLLERIIAYQDANETISPTDLAVAISRTPREGTAAALPLLPKIDARLRPVLAYCLGVGDMMPPKARPYGLLSRALLTMRGQVDEQHNNDIALWAVAGRTHEPQGVFDALAQTDVGDVPFVAAPVSSPVKMKELRNEWRDPVTKKVTYSHAWHELRLELPPYRKLLPAFLYSHDAFGMGGSSSWGYQLRAEDLAYWHSIMPQNGSALALKLLNSLHNNPVGALKAFLGIVHQPYFRFEGYALLVYASCFMDERKDVRLMASEVLHDLVERQHIPLQGLAACASELAEKQFGPLARFADGLFALKDSSPLHNSALFVLLDSLLGCLSPESKRPSNLRKILEHYLDTAMKTQQQPSARARVYLDSLAGSPALKKLIQQLAQAAG